MRCERVGLNHLRELACEVRREFRSDLEMPDMDSIIWDMLEQEIVDREFDRSASVHIAHRELQRHYRERDALVIKTMVGGSSAGNVIDNDRYKMRFRLKNFKYDELVMSKYRHQHEDYRVCPHCGDVAVLNEDTHEFVHSHRKHRPTTVPEDILPMSRLDMRLMRYNNPEAYNQYVDALKREMGPWFDESLVL